MLIFRKQSRIIIFAAALLVVVLIAGFAVDRTSSRHFPMHGSNLSDLQSDYIVDHVAQITGASSERIFVSDSNFMIQTNENFDLYIGGAISIMFPQSRFGSERNYSSQLRIFPDNNDFFVTSAQRYEPSQQYFHLKVYLDALKYLPQEHIRSMVRDNPSIYQIVLRDRSQVVNNATNVFYNEYGLTSDNNWTILLHIQPMYIGEGNDGYTGVGTDIIQIFYVAAKNNTDGVGFTQLSLERIWDSGGSGIDIRYNDVDEFIRLNPSYPAGAMPSLSY